MRRIAAAIFSLLVIGSSDANAMSDGGFFAGIGLYSQSSFNKTTKSDDGSPSLFGAYSFPLVLRYDYVFSDPWSVAPALYYTILPRSSGGSTAQTTFMHLSIPATYKFEAFENELEWCAGVGLSMYQVKGAGGTKTLNNGTGTSTFAVPGGTSTAKLVTLDLGMALLYESHRFSFDLFLEGPGSEDKRTINMMLGYMYEFGGTL